MEGMGRCQEFGPQISPGCGHPMVAGQESCGCPECGVVCTGRFAGCAKVWAVGPIDLTDQTSRTAALPPLDGQAPIRVTTERYSAPKDSSAVGNGAVGNGAVGSGAVGNGAVGNGAVGADAHRPVMRFRAVGTSPGREPDAGQPARQPHEDVVDSLRDLLDDIRAQALDSQQLVRDRLDRIEDRLARVEDELASPSGGQRRVVSMQSSRPTRPQSG